MKSLLLTLIVLFTSCRQNPNSRNASWIEPITKMKFVQIPSGKFKMGNHSLDKKIDSSHTKSFEVFIKEGFWMGTTEVTQQQWQEIMGPKEIHPDKPSPFRNQHPLYPIVSVSFYDVQRFISKLNDLSEDSKFRLPTEAEWEYACKANTRSAYHFGDSISDKLANYNAQIKYGKSRMGNFIGHPVNVASYPPNSWGLFDMHGNVWEWVSDWYGTYPIPNSKNPSGPSSSTLKVIRGGSWYFGAANAQSFFRKTHEPDLWGFSIGFRLVREQLYIRQ